MKRSSRSKKIWKLQYRLPLFNLALSLTLVFHMASIFVLKTVAEKGTGDASVSMMLMGVVLVAVALTTSLLLILIVLLHRSLGPIMQVERVLDQVMQGDFSCRVHFRKKDFLKSLEVKLNKVFAILDEKEGIKNKKK